MHDEVWHESVSNRLATNRRSQQRDANETEIKSLRFKLEPNNEFELQRSADESKRQQMASDIVAGSNNNNNSEAIDQDNTTSSSTQNKRLSQHEAVKMEQKPQEQENNNEQSAEEVNGLDSDEHRGASMCAGCSGPIRDKFIFSVIDLLWHQDCVQCADCSLKLHERCFTFNGKLYCRHDYWYRFGPKCFACHEAINKSELVQRIKGNRVYHLKCFTCSQCNRRLERGEQLHLIDDKQLLCKQDYQQLVLGGARNQKQQQQHQKSGQNQRNGSGNKNGFPQQDSAVSNNNNSSSYFTLLSPHQMRDPQDRATRVKRSSLTSLDNMQDELRLEAELEEEPADEVDEEEELMERHPDGLQQDEVDDEGDDEVETSDLVFGHADNMDLENEENRTSRAAGSQHSTAHELNGSSNKPAGGSANCATATKRRRRRKRATSARQDKDSSVLMGPNRATTTNSKGQSILNGGQSASILANMQAAGGIGQATSGGSSLKCFSSSSTSSSSSTASNHSTSSGSHSQRSSNQLAASGVGRGATTTHQHHQSHPTQHLGGHQQHNSNSASNNNPNNNDHQSANAGHKPTRVRTVLNEKQLQTLRDCYAMNPRPDALMKEQLVDMTGLSPRVIRVWFQNKRCKDKKKSILYKQMQQHEKDGRHLAGLTHIRGVPLVASSPIQYQEEHSSTQQQQQQQSGDSPQQSVQSPAQMSAGGQQPQQNSPGIDIHTYQPPWKSLIDYAQQPPTVAGAAKQQAVGAQPPDRLSASSPRYQQLISQMHGYGHPISNSSEPLPDHQVLELQPPSQQQPTPPTQYNQQNLMLGHQQSPTSSGSAPNPHYPGAPAGTPMMQQPPPPSQQPPPHHLHAHLTQMGAPPQAPPASHHLHQQFQH